MQQTPKCQQSKVCVLTLAGWEGPIPSAILPAGEAGRALQPVSRVAEEGNCVLEGKAAAAHSAIGDGAWRAAGHCNKRCKRVRKHCFNIPRVISTVIIPDGVKMVLFLILG